MKFAPTLLSTVVAACALGAHFTAQATEPSANASGAAAVSNRVGGSFTVGNNGSSMSYSTARNSASTQIGTSTSYTPGHAQVGAGVSGLATTESFGKAFNISTGSGSGSAMSSGRAGATAEGQLAIQGVTRGFNGGSASTQGSHNIVAGTNQGSFAQGNTAAGFDAQVIFSRTGTHVPAATGSTGWTRQSGVSVTGTSTGFATGTNTSGALTGMNAAGIANISGSGTFDAGTDLRAWTRLGRP